MLTETAALQLYGEKLVRFERLVQSMDRKLRDFWWHYSVFHNHSQADSERLYKWLARSVLHRVLSECMVEAEGVHIRPHITLSTSDYITIHHYSIHHNSSFLDIMYNVDQHGSDEIKISLYGTIRNTYTLQTNVLLKASRTSIGFEYGHCSLNAGLPRDAPFRFDAGRYTSSGPQECINTLINKLKVITERTGITIRTEDRPGNVQRVYANSGILHSNHVRPRPELAALPHPRLNTIRQPMGYSPAASSVLFSNSEPNSNSNGNSNAASSSSSNQSEHPEPASSSSNHIPHFLLEQPEYRAPNISRSIVNFSRSSGVPTGSRKISQNHFFNIGMQLTTDEMENLKNTANSGPPTIGRIRKALYVHDKPGYMTLNTLKRTGGQRHPLSRYQYGKTDIRKAKLQRVLDSNSNKNK